MATIRTIGRPATNLFSHGLRRSITAQTPGPHLAIRRTFFPQPTSTPLTLHATRTLPYKASDLYALISDISSYPTYIPYCTSARVETWSSPDAVTNTKWPATATLSIGYGGFSESFLSKVYCVPETLVEAISGDARTVLPAADLAHYEGRESPDSTANELFASLRTRWSLKAYEYKPAERHPDVREGRAHPSEVSVERDGLPGRGEPGIESEPRTDVSLVIEVNWKNPVYAAASQAVAPRVAGNIVEAFERRAREVLGDGKSK